MSDDHDAAASPPLPSAELSCQELVELVTAYLDGALGPAERTWFEEHLAACPGCTIYLDQVRRSIAVLGHLTEESFPPVARERLLRAFRSWKR
jgi:anti-sigma factor RsiW